MDLINVNASPQRPDIIGTYISFLVQGDSFGAFGDYMQMLDWKSKDGYQVSYY
jgi:hypothetical protein